MQVLEYGLVVDDAEVVEHLFQHVLQGISIPRTQAQLLAFESHCQLYENLLDCS